ncbi:MAG TPA: S1 RNA-binding domain-containing protein [Anaerolineaceae bacterium]|nr:S1 RNA-binding domain-containing protein [Anaerolineaceae bacterium]
MDAPVENTKVETNIKPKDKFEGKVLKTSLQGALIDIKSPLPAFLHISQVIDPKNPEAVLKSLDEVIKVDDVVTVWVRRVLKDHVELTMREPLAYEWRELAADMVVHGKVLRLETFGAFVEIGAERPGLIHVSELSHNYVRTPNEVVKVGDEFDVKVLEVDRRKKQIKLSLKALLEAPDEVAPEPKRSGRKGKAQKQEVVEEPAEEVIPDPTYMEIALRKAMDKAEQRLPEITNRVKKSKSYESDADEIYERTMQNKISNKD